MNMIIISYVTYKSNNIFLNLNLLINHNVFNDLKKLFNIDTKFYFLSQPKDKLVFPFGLYSAPIGP